MQRHYADDYRKIIELVRGGALGETRLFALNEYRGDWNPRTWAAKDPQSGKLVPWRHLRSLAGSSLLEFSVHSYGFLYEMIAAPLTKCSAVGGAAHWPERTTEDAIAVIAEFGGVRVQHTYCGFARGADWQLTIAGGKGSLQYDRRKAVVRLTGSDPRELDISEGSDGLSNEARLYRDFFRDVRRPLAVRAESGLRHRSDEARLRGLDEHRRKPLRYGQGLCLSRGEHGDQPA